MDNTFLENFISKFSEGSSLMRFYAAVRGGDNRILHNIVKQSLALDDTWIVTIEDAIHSIENIVRNPRKFIKESEVIVDVAKARRTNAKTVRHLTSHSQFVQNITDEGEVKPKKLLTVEMDDDLAIYENRFICALITRLTSFVEQRHKDLEGKLDVYDQTNVNMTSQFNYGESKISCDIKLQVEEPPEDSQRISQNQDLYNRVAQIRKRLRVLQSTEFMKILSKAKPVRPPIQKTNLLNKNVDYNNCYKLWLFIASYTYAGYSIEVQDKFLPVDGDYYDDLTALSALSIQSLISDRILKKEKYDAIEFSEPEEKNFGLVKSFTFHPNFDQSREQSGAETINEYYFRRMKDELVKIAQEGELAIENKLNVNFVKFFRAISRINDEMYNELIEDQIVNDSDKIVKSPVERKRQQIKEQKERLRRRKLFTKLKWEELERAQRMEERAAAKLEKLRAELEQAKLDSMPKRVTKMKLKTLRRKKNDQE